MSTLPSSPLEGVVLLLAGEVARHPWAAKGAGEVTLPGVVAAGVELLGRPGDTSASLLLARVGWGEPGGGGCKEGEKEGGGAAGICCSPA